MLMKSIAAGLAGTALLATVAFAQAPTATTDKAAPAATATMTTTSASGEWRFRRGVNAWPWFALTREFPAPRTDYDWPPFQSQRPVPTPDDLGRLRQTGLDFIRLPVDPGPFLAADAATRAKLLDMVDAAVAASLDAGLGIIVNVQANGATHYWNPDRMLSSTAAPEFAAYRGLVGELAGRLARFTPGMVALEPVNEPAQSCDSNVWSQVQASLLTAARASSRTLPLVVTGGCGSMVSGLAALDPAPLAAFEPILFTFHFYEPYLFSHQGAPWMREPVYRALNNVPWPASAISSTTADRAPRAPSAATASRCRRWWSGASCCSPSSSTGGGSSAAQGAAASAAGVVGGGGERVSAGGAFEQPAATIRADRTVAAHSRGSSGGRGMRKQGLLKQYGGRTRTWATPHAKAAGAGRKRCPRRRAGLGNARLRLA